MKVTMRDMLEAGVHFGHKTRLWDPKMKPYIYGSRYKVHIINLEHSLPLFRDALNFASSVAARKGKVLFVGTKSVAAPMIKAHAERCSMPYVNHRWLGGMLTNWKTIRLSIRRLRDLEKMFEKNDFSGLTKKERLSLQREYTKLNMTLGGIKNMGGLPDAIFVIDVGAEKIAIDEANKLGIPVIGIVDTNNSPDGIDYVIPGNDDSFRSVELYCTKMADVIFDSRKKFVAEEEAKAKAKAAKLKAKPTAKKDEKAKKVITKKITKSEPATKAAADKKAAEPKAKKADEKKTIDTKTVDEKE